MKTQPIHADRGGNHPALDMLRRRTVLNEMLFAGEWFQWHLHEGTYDRTPCCRRHTRYAIVADHNGPETAYWLVRECLGCGLEYRFDPRSVQAWLMVQISRRWLRTHPSPS